MHLDHTSETNNVNATTPDYSKYSAAELDAEIVDARDAVDVTLAKSNRELKQRLIPALKEMRVRYKKPGARTDLRPLPEPSWEQYLISRGLKPDTVRNWFQQSGSRKKLQRLLRTTATSGKHPGSSKKTARLGIETDTKHHTSTTAEGGNEPLLYGLPAKAIEETACEALPRADPIGAKRARLYEVDVFTAFEGTNLLVQVYLVDSDEDSAKQRAEAMVEFHADVCFEEIKATHVRTVDHVLVGEYVDFGAHNPLPASAANKGISVSCGVEKSTQRASA